MQDTTETTRTRAEINRENAQKSTGPRTPEGKEAQRPLPAAQDKSRNSPQEPPAASPFCASSQKKASLNALRHGITAQVIIMTEEDVAAYKAFTAKYHVHFKPADLVEEQLVQTLADSQWRLNRYRSVENTILATGFDKRSDMWIVDNPQTHGAFTADGYSYKTKDLATLGIQRKGRRRRVRFARVPQKEQRVFKQYNQTYAKLEAMQTARKRQERIDLSHAANLYAMHQAENPPSKDPQVPRPQYVPAQDGFVLRIPEIVAYIVREERLRRSRDYENSGVGVVSQDIGTSYRNTALGAGADTVGIAFLGIDLVIN